MSKRILQVVGSMNRGGTETWLMHVLRHIDRERFQMDFLVHTTQPCAYDDEIRSLGSKIIPCLHPSNPLFYGHNFSRILAQYGPYDIVHSHVHHYSGYVLRLAYQARVPMRIAHNHNDTSMLTASAKLPRKIYLHTTKKWIQCYATIGLAASRKAAPSLFGGDWEKDPRWRILYCGIDLEPFNISVDRAEVRGELGIPERAVVIGHVGRFVEQKNHSFLVDVAAEIVKREPEARFLLIGDGPLRQTIMEKIGQAGLDKWFIFTGLRSDVPRLMKGAMNAFLFPSFNEGLPLAGLEAIAAGLPIVMSDTITDELNIVPELVSSLSPNDPASVWAELVLKQARNLKAELQEKAQSILAESQFDIRTSVSRLESVYLC